MKTISEIMSDPNFPHYIPKSVRELKKLSKDQLDKFLAKLEKEYAEEQHAGQMYRDLAAHYPMFSGQFEEIASEEEHHHELLAFMIHKVKLAIRLSK
jgi:rubrerythrin